MSIKEAFEKEVIQFTFEKDDNNTKHVFGTVKATDGFFEDHVLKPCGVTLEQYQQVQNNIRELADITAVKIKPLVMAHLNTDTCEFVTTQFELAPMQVLEIQTMKDFDGHPTAMAVVTNNASRNLLSKETIDLYFNDVNN